MKRDWSDTTRSSTATTPASSCSTSPRRSRTACATATVLAAASLWMAISTLGWRLVRVMVDCSWYPLRTSARSCKRTWTSPASPTTMRPISSRSANRASTRTTYSAAPSAMLPPVTSTFSRCSRLAI